MKRNIMLMIKGFFFGLANIIPGVSGGTIALTMGIYEDLIAAISHFFKNFKKNVLFLLPLVIGAGLAILLMSKVISYSLDHYPFPTTLFFIGLIFGGIPLLTKKVKGQKIKKIYPLCFLIPFGIIIGMAFMKEGSAVASLTNITPSLVGILFLVGMVAAATMVIPGVSGSFVLMLLGYYKPIVKTIGNLTNFSEISHNLLILIPFGFGVLVGIILVAKLIEYLFKKYEVPTYYAILGFIIASILTLMMGLIGVSVTNIEVFIGIILFIVATLIGYKLGDV